MTTKLRQDQVNTLGGCEPCRFQPVEREPTEPLVRGGKPGPSVRILDPTKTSFVGIELVDSEKKPVPSEAFRVVLPDGAPVTGNLDALGKVRIEGIDPGSCTITFPEIDRRDFV